MKQINKLLSHSLKNRWHLFPDYIRRSRANSHFDLACMLLHIWLCLAGRGLTGAMWLSAGCYWSSPGRLHSLHGRSPHQAADLKSRPAGFSLWGWACGVWACTLVFICVYALVIKCVSPTEWVVVCRDAHFVPMYSHCVQRRNLNIKSG